MFSKCVQHAKNNQFCQAPQCDLLAYELSGDAEIFRELKSIFNVADNRRRTVLFSDNFNNIKTKTGRLDFQPLQVADSPRAR